VIVSLPALGSLVAEKYRVEALLGEGGMGAVFRARHELMDKAVALKWLHPRLWNHQEAKERFLSEARMVARIRHPNVVEVFDICVRDDALFMVMELLEGESFDRLLARGTEPIPRALAILLDAMAGVAAAHARSIVHRDIKPENIFLARVEGAPAPVAKILDFGISKLLQDGDGGTATTKTGTTMGTPAYMSPEHMRGARDLDARADVYSFGVLLYRLLTGELPYGEDTFANVAVKQATTRPPSPKELRPALPGYLSDLVMKAMAYEREQRHPSLKLMMEALRPVTTDSSYVSMLTSPCAEVPKVGRPQEAGVREPNAATRQLPERQGPAIHAVGTTPPSRRSARVLWTAFPVGLLVALALFLTLRRASPEQRTPAPADNAPTGADTGRAEGAAPQRALAPRLDEQTALPPEPAEVESDVATRAHQPAQPRPADPSLEPAPARGQPPMPTPPARAPPARARGGAHATTPSASPAPRSSAPDAGAGRAKQANPRRSRPRISLDQF
jgi:serine/threonine protein kinase